jgi:hypothetical protein
MLCCTSFTVQFPRNESHCRLHIELASSASGGCCAIALDSCCCCAAQTPGAALHFVLLLPNWRSAATGVGSPGLSPAITRLMWRMLAASALMRSRASLWGREGGGGGGA